jgi:hypothetical protein
MTKPVKTPEAVGFREDPDGVDMVFNIGTDAELRMIVPANAAIEWGRQLMLLGMQIEARRAQEMHDRFCGAAGRSVWVHRELGHLERPDS